MSTQETIEHLASDVLTGNRRALARACSLVESTTDQDREQAVALLELLLPHCGPSRRIGVSGAPGVGKSTFVEALGLHAIESGSRVAVLAIDPSSRRTGGSILGDKVRMQHLSNHPNAYVRPSPSRLALGGATSTTRELIVLCEAASYDTIVVETVGVGQSEIDVADMVDLFLLLVLPTAGDDIQGIKRGIMEVADVIVVTKSDLDAMAAKRAVAQYTGSLRYMLPSQQRWTSAVVDVSSTTAHGLDAIVEHINAFFAAERAHEIAVRRRDQRDAWFNDSLHRRLMSLLESDQRVRDQLTSLRHSIADGRMLPSTAVHHLLASLSISFQGPRS